MSVLLTIFILLDTAHRLSPLVLSWMHPGFRSLMLHEPRRYILLPLAVFSAGALISVATGAGLTTYVPGPGRLHHATGLDNPFPIMVGIYFLWNFWHFAMQNYGVLRLCGCAPERRWKVLAFVATAIGFKISYPVIFVHHWMTDLGLSARVMGRHWWIFLAGLLLVAPIAFVYCEPPWLVPQLDYVAFRTADNLWMVMLIGLATSVSFAHFIISRLLWTCRSPIGKELLA